MSVRELAAEYVLGELDPERRVEVERRMASDTELRAEVAAMSALGDELAALPGDAWPAAPSETGAESTAIATSIAEADSITTEAAPSATRRAPVASKRRGWRDWTLRPAYALASVLAALAIGLGAGLLIAGGSDSGSGPSATPVAELSLEPVGPSGGGHGTVAMPEADEMLLTVSDLPPSHRGEYYELWLLGGGEAETVPVASFHVGADGTARLRVPLPLDPAEYEYFDVSRQVLADGTAHSGDSVLRGRT